MIDASRLIEHADWSCISQACGTACIAIIRPLSNVNKQPTHGQRHQLHAVYCYCLLLPPRPTLLLALALSLALSLSLTYTHNGGLCTTTWLSGSKSR
jgi:hypothetical protein